MNARLVWEGTRVRVIELDDARANGREVFQPAPGKRLVLEVNLGCDELGAPAWQRKDLDNGLDRLDARHLVSALVAGIHDLTTQLEVSQPTQEDRNV